MDGEQITPIVDLQHLLAYLNLSNIWNFCLPFHKFLINKWLIKWFLLMTWYVGAIYDNLVKCNIWEFLTKNRANKTCQTCVVLQYPSPSICDKKAPKVFFNIWNENSSLMPKQGFSFLYFQLKFYNCCNYCKYALTYIGRGQWGCLKFDLPFINVHNWMRYYINWYWTYESLKHNGFSCTIS